MRMFLDASVLIAAARGTDEESQKAMLVLDDPDRVFVASEFLKLEVLPKAIYNGKQDEVAFYNTFFAAVAEWPESNETVLRQAQHEANQFGLSALDALHVAAAAILDADELVTLEREQKPIHRVDSVAVRSL